MLADLLGGLDFAGVRRVLDELRGVTLVARMLCQASDPEAQAAHDAEVAGEWGRRKAR